MQISRRGFLAAAGAAAFEAKSGAQAVKTPIGVDLYSIRLTNWNPYEYLDYLAKIHVQLGHFSVSREMAPMMNDDAALKKVRAYAQKVGVGIELAANCICVSSRSYDPKSGKPEEHLGRAIDAARILGAPVVRVFQGAAADRNKETPFEVHMENTLRVLKNLRSKIVDSGIKVAMENHADFQARELKQLVEEAGKGVLYVCLDSGNPPYILEDPHLTLEMLAPYAVTTHVRDTAVWRVPEGVAVRWVNIGDGNVDIAGWVKKLVKLRPDLSVSVENIVSPAPQLKRIYEPAFWDGLPKMPAWELARLLAIADNGKPSPGGAPGSGKSPGEQQCADLEISIGKLREILQAA